MVGEEREVSVECGECGCKKHVANMDSCSYHRQTCFCAERSGFQLCPKGDFYVVCERSLSFKQRKATKYFIKVKLGSGCFRIFPRSEIDEETKKSLISAKGLLCTDRYLRGYIANYLVEQLNGSHGEWTLSDDVRFLVFEASLCMAALRYSNLDPNTPVQCTAVVDGKTMAYFRTEQKVTVSSCFASILRLKVEYKLPKAMIRNYDLPDQTPFFMCYADPNDCDRLVGGMTWLCVNDRLIVVSAERRVSWVPVNNEVEEQLKTLQWSASRKDFYGLVRNLVSARDAEIIAENEEEQRMNNTNLNNIDDGVEEIAASQELVRQHSADSTARNNNNNNNNNNSYAMRSTNNTSNNNTERPLPELFTRKHYVIDSYHSKVVLEFVAKRVVRCGEKETDTRSIQVKFGQPIYASDMIVARFTAKDFRPWAAILKARWTDAADQRGSVIGNILAKTRRIPVLTELIFNSLGCVMDIWSCINILLPRHLKLRKPDNVIVMPVEHSMIVEATHGPQSSPLITDEQRKVLVDRVVTRFSSTNQKIENNVAYTNQNPNHNAVFISNFILVASHQRLMRETSSLLSGCGSESLNALTVGRAGY